MCDEFLERRIWIDRVTLRFSFSLGDPSTNFLAMVVKVFHDSHRLQEGITRDSENSVFVNFHLLRKLRPRLKTFCADGDLQETLEQSSVFDS
jgi:hypothetical protein